jgi:hypothetical protein
MTDEKGDLGAGQPETPPAQPQAVTTRKPSRRKPVPSLSSGTEVRNAPKQK